MLYQIHELQKILMDPLVHWAQLNAKLFSDPVSPLAHSPFSPKIAAGYELLHRLGKSYEKPRFDITKATLLDRNFHPTEENIDISETVVLEKPFCRLLHFKKKDAEKTRPKQAKVLLVAPLSGHHATLLRDTVQTLLACCEVYITDWKDARMVPLDEGRFGLEDYVAYVQNFLQICGAPVHIIAVCQSTVPVLAAVSLLSSQKSPYLPQSMTLMGGPVDARCSPTQVNSLATEKDINWFKTMLIQEVPMRYPGAGRLVYPGFLQYAGFIAMNPQRHAQSHWDFYNHLCQGDYDSTAAHRRFYDEYNAVLDMDAEYYLDTVKIVFQEFRLPKGEWHIAGQPVRPQDISKVALFTIEGELDDISGANQTHAAHHLCSGLPENLKKSTTVSDCGHYGIFSGRRFREIIFPEVVRFILSHENAQ